MPPEGDTSTVPKSSLEILNPPPWVPDTTTHPPSETSLKLSRLSKSLIEIFCELDFSNSLMRYASPNFQAFIDFNSSQVRSLQEHIEFHKWMRRNNPGYVYEVVGVEADVDEEKGLASVWATLRVTGHPVRVRRESITILFWRRKRGEWMCYKQVGVRGVEWF